MFYWKEIGVNVTAKEYLMQIRSADIRIKQKLLEYKELEILRASTKAFVYSKEIVQTSHSGNRLETEFVRCEELLEEINKEIDCFTKMKHKIINEILSLKNDTYVSVLFKKYVEYKNLETIAEEMIYTYQYVRKLHGYALQEFLTVYTKLH